MQLYPLKFSPIYKQKIWGGQRFTSLLNRVEVPFEHCGESWELSGVEDNYSVVSNGILAGNDIQELIEIYMDELVGEHVYEKFGLEFPLLIKFLDVSDILSIQVHPTDELARSRHKAFGKTEMMYVAYAEEGAEMVSGFNQTITREDFIKYSLEKRLTEVLHFEKANKGDVFFIPAGRVHTPGKGMLIAEVQQTSDVTYRIYDWDRVDDDGQLRELHLDLALDCLDYSGLATAKTSYTLASNDTASILTNQYFTTNIIDAESEIVKDYNDLDSFVVYLCLEGSGKVIYNNGDDYEEISSGQTMLIPASLKDIRILPQSSLKILEVFVP